jgi:hypothetical protein
MHPASAPRPLTLDQKKAAEAAFQGLPFDPKWSPAAKAVYDGIVEAQKGQPVVPEVVSTPSDGTAQLEPEKATEPPEPIITREEAIQSGFLIDVTPIANTIGLPVPVAITKPLWDFAITASATIPDDQHEARVRDVLMALRLRLATQRVAPPGIEFPALLTFPPEPAPQLCSLYAIAHGDSTAPFSLTVLLSHEVAAIIRPMNN